ncbi:baculoviral IAP repeat-containing protein 2 isoform X2 [Aricia agestis]|uniref:baculoviral IAP repeat-containing protein 2 isoform X2 n=1 Tax=Aricia agestis TaxID=91739 RepID=UPI001C209343|nr:baculoviral IAP repeat-containing protein 2 isoform X2 [Aricia agestis]
MNLETNRLNTFINWPGSAPVDPIRIAKAGFFYTGQGTEVECFSCGGKISDWHYGDQAMWRHRRMDPNCAFVLNPGLSGNVPLVLSRECTPAQRNRSETDNIQGPDVPQDYGLTEEDELYKSYVLRLLSFVNWEDTSVSREALVSAGFYHVGGGRVRCAWCGGELAPFSSLGSLGSPLEVHRMYFPRCSLATTLANERQNIQISTTSQNTPTLEMPLVNTTVKGPTSAAEQNERVVAAGGAWRELGVVGGSARHPDKASLAARLATFERWPANRPQDPRTLADAGFFYTGVDDQVRCFYCDGGLAKWEAGDGPWSEHAHWFPTCGYILLVKGQEFIDTCRKRNGTNRDRGRAMRTRSSINFPITESQVEEGMCGPFAAAALGAGLDAARVRRAISRRLRATGVPFTSSEALIDAVLDEQLNEEAWSETPQSSRLARDILAETLSEFLPNSGVSTDERSDSQESHYESPIRTPTPNTTPRRLCPVPVTSEEPRETQDTVPEEKKQLTLEEENRQLKEARLCKVCMDNEVSVVFLPCGHLVSCAGCGAALAACPLCRAAVRALVRAYLA